MYMYVEIVYKKALQARDFRTPFYNTQGFPCNDFI